MGDVIDLHRQPLDLSSDLGREIILAFAQYSEGLMDEKTIRRRFRFTDAVYEQLGNDDELVRAIEKEKVRRIKDGSFKKERAQQLVVKAPDVLSEILLDSSANAKHRIDSAKVLDSLAVGGAEGGGAAAADRFIINIVLNSDDGSAPHVLHFDKSRSADPTDVSPDDIDTAPWELLAAKKKDDGSGQPI